MAISKIHFALGVLMVAVVLMVLKNIYYPRHKLLEGFSDQAEGAKYQLFQTPVEIYDKLYASIYDELVGDKTREGYEVKHIAKYLGLGNSKSTPQILDVGCGTGGQLALLSKMGASCVGLDASQAMLDAAAKKLPESGVELVKGGALKAITFEPASFSAILCLYFTIYYMKDKNQFFENCRRWLKPGGVLVLHLVNRDKFSPIVNAADPLVMISPQNYSKERITESVVDFNAFRYKAKFEPANSVAKFNEYFKFKNSGKIRHNEHTLYMETQKQILGMAKNHGFELEDKINLGHCGYENQYLYILRSN